MSTASLQPTTQGQPVQAPPVQAMQVQAPPVQATSVQAALVQPSADPATTQTPPALPVSDPVVAAVPSKQTLGAKIGADLAGIKNEVESLFTTAKQDATAIAGNAQVTGAFEEAAGLILASLNSAAAGTPQSAPTPSIAAVAGAANTVASLVTDVTSSNWLAMSEIIMTIIQNCQAASGGVINSAQMIATANAPNLIHRLAVGSAVKAVLGSDTPLTKVHAVSQAIIQGAANASPSLIDRLLAEMASVGL